MQCTNTMLKEISTTHFPSWFYKVPDTIWKSYNHNYVIPFVMLIIFMCLLSSLLRNKKKAEVYVQLFHILNIPFS